MFGQAMLGRVSKTEFPEAGMGIYQTQVGILGWI